MPTSQTQSSSRPRGSREPPSTPKSYVAEGAIDIFWGGKQRSLLEVPLQRMVSRKITVVAVLLSQVLVVSASFSMVVEHGVEECFVIRAPREKSIIRYVSLTRHQLPLAP